MSISSPSMTSASCGIAVQKTPGHRTLLGGPWVDVAHAEAATSASHPGTSLNLRSPDVPGS
eukprot:15477511-Alexandrium_andersonii.AAC.1